MRDKLKLDEYEQHEAPFPHSFLPSVMCNEAAELLLNWFETSTPWKFRSEDDFYETFDANLRFVQLPQDLVWVINEEFLAPLRAFVSAIFGVSLLEKIDVHAQKLTKGYRIGVHTDFGRRRQTHRLVVQLNRSWSPELGGILMLFDKGEPDAPSPVDRYYFPEHRSGVLFEISPYSYHAVSVVGQAERYTLVFSFYSVDGYSKFEGRYPAQLFEKD